MRVFSGIQPSGAIHLGNYLGAISNWVKNQNDNENIFCIVDLHTITMPITREKLQDSIYYLAAALLASGIDPHKSTLFVQSDIDYHGALSFILDCFIPMGDMSRMTQYKDKSAKNKVPNVGLFNYPALMAADILLYDAQIVPVGEDQKQHLELTRDVAMRFNNTYGEIFVVPQALIATSSARVMGLNNPESKMSKSDDNKNNAIFLTDSDDEINKKIKRATTDNDALIKFDKERKGIYNLLSIYESLTGRDKITIEREFEGLLYGALKSAIADALIAKIAPIRGEINRLLDDKAYLKSILDQGATKADRIASTTYKKVKNAIGLGL